jgi:cytochrome c oxidase subunit 4
MTGSHTESHHTVPYGLYVKVWVALLILTAITVGASYIDFGHVGLFTALLIATIKGTCVALYFMHLRFERPMYTVMVMAVLITYGIFIGLTFSDYLYR